MTFFIILGAFAMVLLGAGPSHPQSKSKPAEPGRVLPAETLVVFYLPDFSQTKERFQATALHGIWSEPGVQEFLKPITDRVHEGIGRLKAGFREDLGIPLDEFYPAFSGGVCVALLDLKPPKKEAPVAKALPCDPDVLKTLKRIVTQQRVFVAQAEVDQDGDGWGEYGLLGELAGEIARRPDGKDVIAPAYLPPEFATAGSKGKGYATAEDYHYRVFLPMGASSAGDDRSLGGTSRKGGAKAPAPAIDLQEKHFLVYAWSAKGNAADAVYATNEKGDTYMAEMKETSYSSTKTPKVDAAYPSGQTPFTGKMGGVGGDSNYWTRADQKDAGKESVDLVPALAVLLTPKDREAVEKLVPRFDGMLRISDPELKLEEATIGRQTVARIWHKKSGKKRAIYHTWLGATLLITLNADEVMVEQLITNWRRKGGKSLSDNAGYASVEEHTQAGKNGDISSDAFLYVAVARILTAFEEQIGEANRPLINALGLSDIQAAGASLAIDGKGIRDAVYLHAPGKRKGVLDLLSADALDPSLIAIVPASARSCVVTRFNPDLLWDNIDAFVKSIGEAEHAKFLEGLEQVNRFLKVDVEDEVIPAFGDVLVAYSEPVAEQGGPVGPLHGVLLLRVKDQAIATSVVERLREGLSTVAGLTAMKKAKEAGQEAPVFTPAPWQQVEHRGTVVRFLAAPDAPLGPLAHALTKEYLILSMRPDMVRRAIDRLAANDGGIKQKPDFKTAMEKVGSGYGSLWYMDMKGFYAGARQFLPLALTKMSGGMPFDLSKLPPVEVVEKHLFDQITVLRSDAKGISVVGYSPIGSVGALVGVVGVGLGMEVLPELMK